MTSTVPAMTRINGGLGMLVGPDPAQFVQDPDMVALLKAAIAQELGVPVEHIELTISLLTPPGASNVVVNFTIAVPFPDTGPGIPPVEDIYADLTRPNFTDAVRNNTLDNLPLTSPNYTIEIKDSDIAQPDTWAFSTTETTISQTTTV